MADWYLPSGERSEYSTAKPSRGAANAKGAYVQLLAATGFAYSGVNLTIVPQGAGGQCYLVDLAIGASGSEQVVVPNILLDSSRGANSGFLDFALPVHIPAGVRLSTRIQEVGGAGTREVQVTAVGRSGGFNQTVANCGSVVNYGANTSNSNGVLVDPGATLNTFGAWTELTASTSRPHTGLMVIFGTNQQTTTLVDSIYNFQIGIGAAGAEVVLDECMSALWTTVTRLYKNSWNVAANIPVGTRLSMRSKCVSSSAAAARHTTAIILGY